MHYAKMTSGGKTMYKNRFIKNIKKARNNKNLTQREVAQKTGISQSTIARLETGEREPDLNKLGTLADFYEISIDWLLETKQAKKITN